MVSRKLYKLFWVVYIVIIATAQSQNHPTNLNKQGFMADGFDVVSYFSGTPEKGKSAYVAEYQSAKFMFRSEDNKKKFLENPEKYVPAYGGYCAYAMAKTGELVEVNPKAYEIRNGKLYLFYKTVFDDTYEKWLSENPNALVQRADKNWEKVH